MFYKQIVNINKKFIFSWDNEKYTKSVLKITGQLFFGNIVNLSYWNRSNILDWSLILRVRKFNVRNFTDFYWLRLYNVIYCKVYTSCWYLLEWSTIWYTLSQFARMTSFALSRVNRILKKQILSFRVSHLLGKKKCLRWKCIDIILILSKIYKQDF